MDQSELNKLLAFYRRALEEQNVEAIGRSVNLLEKHLPNVDQTAQENFEGMANLNRVHLRASELIKMQSDAAKAEMDRLGNNKARDFAYQRTQASQSL